MTMEELSLEGLSEQMARQYACWCAERVLPIFEKWNQGDMRARIALEVGRLLAQGEAGNGVVENARKSTADAGDRSEKIEIESRYAGGMWTGSCDAAWDAARHSALSTLTEPAHLAAKNASFDAAWALAWDADPTGTDIDARYRALEAEHKAQALELIRLLKGDKSP